MTRLVRTGRVRAAVAAVGVVLCAAEARAQGSIAVAPDGSIFVAVRNAVLRVDPLSGAVQTVSSATVGNGPVMVSAYQVTVEADGSPLVTADTGQTASWAEILRIDPSSGDRTIVSGGGTGSGPPLTLLTPSIAVAPDGILFVGDMSPNNSDGIQRVDPASGDRTVVTAPGVGTGPGIHGVAAVAVEPAGTLAYADELGDAVLRVDPATGDRTIVSDASTGSGRPFGWLQGVATEADSTLVVLDSYRELRCVQYCPSPFCVLCVANAPTVFRVDPADGDRTVVSGSGTCLYDLSVCLTPALGHRGRGPDLEYGYGIAIETPQSFVVADTGRVVRVHARSGRREVVAAIAPASAIETRQREDVLRRLAALDPRRVFRPRNPAAWLRRALGDAAAGLNLRRPEGLFAGLPADRARVVADRLYAALWKTMGDVLGPDHPDTVAAARDPQ